MGAGAERALLRPPEPTGTGRGYRPPRPPEKRGGRSSASRYRRPKQPSLGTRLLSRQGASCLPTARQREKASAEPFYLANAKEVRNALRIGERSVFRSTPADLRRGETDSMFIFREDLEIKIKFGKKKKKKVSCANPAALAAAARQRQGRKMGEAIVTTRRAPHRCQLPDATSRAKGTFQGTGKGQQNPLTRSPSPSAQLRWVTDGRHEPQKKKPPKNQTFLAPSSSSPLFLLLLLSFPGWGGSEQRRSPQNTPPRSTPARSTMIKPPSLRQGTKQVL